MMDGGIDGWVFLVSNAAVHDSTDRQTDRQTDSRGRRTRARSVGPYSVKVGRRVSETSETRRGNDRWMMTPDGELRDTPRRHTTTRSPRRKRRRNMLTARSIPTRATATFNGYARRRERRRRRERSGSIDPRSIDITGDTVLTHSISFANDSNDPADDDERRKTDGF